MTLKSYPPAQLEDLAWRFFDLAATLRKMAKDCQSQGITGLDLHDKKPSEWLANLQDWTDRAQAELDVRLIRARAMAAAARVQSDRGPSHPAAPAPRKAAKKKP